MSRLIEPWPEVPELASLYDIGCLGRLDHDFYLDLAADLGSTSVVDVGCGTGVFAVDVARRGLETIGVDPAGAVLDVARSRPGGADVTWVHGDLSLVDDDVADLVIMMGHVAQYFVEDDDWAAVLTAIHRVLVPGGHLAFETRNPDRGWSQRWTRSATERTHLHPNGGEFTAWVESQDKHGSTQSYTMTHEGNTVLPDGSHLRTLETLRFRSPDEVRASLAAAAFEIVDTWGDWTRQPFGATSDEFIVLAEAAPGVSPGEQLRRGPSELAPASERSAGPGNRDRPGATPDRGRLRGQ